MCVCVCVRVTAHRYAKADPNAKSDLDEEDAVELSSFTRKEGEAGADFAVRVFDFVFRHKISSLLARVVAHAHVHPTRRAYKPFTIS